MNDQAPEESRGAMRWVVLALMALIIFANYYLYDCFSTLKGTLQTELGASSTQWGLIRNFYNVPNTFLFMALLGGIFLGWRMRRYQKRWNYRGGPLLQALQRLGAATTLVLTGLERYVVDSGTDEFQGSAFAFVTSNDFASQRRRGLFELEQENFTRYDVGLSLGGPIVKEKLRFFVAGRQQYGADRAYEFDDDVFDPSNPSFHPVVSPGVNRNVPSLQLVGSDDRRDLDLNRLTDIGVRLVGRLVGRFVRGLTLRLLPPPTIVGDGTGPDRRRLTAAHEVFIPRRVVGDVPGEVDLGQTGDAAAHEEDDQDHQTLARHRAPPNLRTAVWYS